MSEHGSPPTMAERVQAKIAAEAAALAAGGKGPARGDCPKPSGTGFEFTHNADILVKLRPTEWRIRDVLVDQAFYYNFGDSGHFKTFVELDRCLCIAAGLAYHGHQVRQGAVFYIAGEGQQGIGRRIAAWHAAHGTRAEDVPFFVSEAATQLMDPAAVDEIRKAVDQMSAEYGPPALIAIDTLARNFGEGDENQTKDMNRVINNMDRSFGTDFLRSLNHHTGLVNKERARGSYALHCAADIAFRVSLTAAGQVLVECLKMKDAKNAMAMLFDRRDVALDIEGTRDRSFVLELAAEGDEALELSKSEKAVDLKGGLAEALAILRNMHARRQEDLQKSGTGCEISSVLFTDWRASCMSAGLYKRTDNFLRASDALLLKGFIQFDDTKKRVHVSDNIENDGY